MGRLCRHRLLGLVARHRSCHCGEHRLRVDWGWAGATLALLLRLAPTLTGAAAAAVTGAGAAAWPAGSQGSAASLAPGTAVASCSHSVVLTNWLAGQSKRRPSCSSPRQRPDMATQMYGKSFAWQLAVILHGAGCRQDHWGHAGCLL